MNIYLDNAATSFPKPPAVVSAMVDYLKHFGASPGRSAHRLSVRAAREVFETRQLLAGFFNLDSSERVVFTANATLALNIAIKGILKKGDHAIISHMEHNSVHRPLRFLERAGLIELSVATCDAAGFLDLNHFKTLFRPNTKMVAMIHGSNVSGTVQQIGQAGHICKLNNAIFLVDAAQTAGFIPIDMQRDHIDILAFTGHKKLYGPPGVGGLCIGRDIMIETFVHGGSGSKSEFDTHPEIYPDRLEAGTPNTVGILGLKAGLEFVMGKGLGNIMKQQLDLTSMLIEEISKLDKIKLYGPSGIENRLPLLSVTIDGIDPGALSHVLDRDYGIMTRPGLHCAPMAHKTIGSFPQGGCRFSLGAFNTEADILKTINALKEILYKNQKL
ncbi:MAG TPA: aminotransferase class V-fold PLP-dependent enzyme [Bacteroidales bacterium]|nr:aminotransferase class V-fold PLP-dependent enzyme [Bacteroidales bacterium]